MAHIIRFIKDSAYLGIKKKKLWSVFFSWCVCFGLSMLRISSDKMHIEKFLNPYSFSKGFETVLDCLPEC